MQRIFWIGSPFFQASLRDCGWDVYFHNFEDIAIFGWEDIVRIAGFTPDIVVVADKSRPPFILNMENFPCLTVFYAVDTHIHSWYDLYAQAFDVCLVSLKDHVELFQNRRLTNDKILWSPPFARNTDMPNPEIIPEWDALFVGTINAQNTPKRLRFFQQLKEAVPSLHIERGQYQSLFPKGRILLNHCEHADLNFRVFEALACGGCLLTPRVKHNLVTGLFIDGEELITYEPENVQDVIFKIQFLLEHEDVRLHIAQKGFEAVDQKHRAIHRAQTFTDFMCDIFMNDAQSIIQQRQAKAKEIREHWLRAPYLFLAETAEIDLLRKAYLLAAKGTFNHAQDAL